MTYASNRDWARRFDDDVQLRICQALRIVDVAPADEDRRHNTDFVLYRSVRPSLRIAARVRRQQYAIGGNLEEITIRTAVPSGQPTEWHKLMAGWGDFMLYGFADDDSGNRLCAWTVTNLALFREHVPHANRDPWRDLPPPPRHRRNRDGTEFVAWSVYDLAACPQHLGMLVTHHGIPGLEQQYLDPMLQIWGRV